VTSGTSWEGIELLKGLVLIIATVFCFPASAQHLKVKDRDNFIRGSMKRCLASQAASPKFLNLSGELIKFFCLCYSTGVADNATTEAVQATDETVINAVVEGERTRCYQAMQIEAERMKNAGQLPTR
jgi:hypothetical protein